MVCLILPVAKGPWLFLEVQYKHIFAVHSTVNTKVGQHNLKCTSFALLCLELTVIKRPCVAGAVLQTTT